jgi:hypothetical protein
MANYALQSYDCKNYNTNIESEVTFALIDVQKL